MHSAVASNKLGDCMSDKCKNDFTYYTKDKFKTFHLWRDFYTNGKANVIKTYAELKINIYKGFGSISFLFL